MTSLIRFASLLCLFMIVSELAIAANSIPVSAPSILGLVSAVAPPAGGPYVIRKHVIANGGQRANGGTYALTGTLAQTMVDPAPATIAVYTLSGGFHIPLTPRPDGFFANGFED